MEILDIKTNKGENSWERKNFTFFSIKLFWDEIINCITPGNNTNPK
jgi:hypothetical protein